MLSNIPNRLEKLISEEIFDQRPVLHMPPAYEINGHLKNICCQNISMWGVYPENFDWRVATVNSEFKLDAPISRKSPKTIENLHFLIQGNFQWIFFIFLDIRTSHSRSDFREPTYQSKPLGRHPSSLCFEKKYFSHFLKKMEISA